MLARSIGLFGRRATKLRGRRDWERRWPWVEGVVTVWQKERDLIIAEWSENDLYSRTAPKAV